MNSSEKNYQFD